ncbi:hypothetical protein [Aquipuribacter hungaricus]|uniref:Uncharacterized protein n=1 Tax=Aquipuribacter hungaricus TaxID=545624 RepID=A0ABV7WND2_9MICO
MSTPSPTPVPVQTPPPPLARALDLLDGLLLRDDVPTAVLLDLGDTFDDLLDVRPGYPPTTPTASTDPWPTVLKQVSAALHDTVSTAHPTVPPATVISWALALRTIRATTPTTDGGTDGTDPGTGATTTDVQR